MKKVVAGIVFIFLSLLFSSWVAAKVGVTLSLDRVEATLEDSIRMEINVSGSRSSDAPPVLSGTFKNGLEDFMVTKGGTSSRVEIVNGKINSGIAYTYFIQPRKTGTFKIGPVSIKVDGRILESNSATLTIKASSQQSGYDHKPVFIEASISSHNVYVEQQALYTLKLYRRINVDDLSLNLPEIEHITFKQLDRPHEYQTTCAGSTYQVLEIRYVLLVSKEGDYVIGSSKMNMTVRRSGRRSPFDDFFSSSSGRPMTVASKPLELKVLVLPEEGKSADFSGLVGKFQIKSRLEPTDLKAGESATLTVQVSGRGNINRIPDIDLPEMPFARIYSDQPVLEAEQDAHGFGGKKTMKWAIVPEKAGRFEIPVLTLSFFNPETVKYNVLHTPAHTLSVLPGEMQEVAAFHSSPGTGKTAESPIKKEIQQIGKDILPIHTSADNLSASYQTLSTGWRFQLALIGPLLIYLILLGSLKLRNQSPERLALSKSRNAFKALTKHCKQNQPCCADLIDVFKNYLNDRFGLSVGTLTADDADGFLQKQGANSETARKMCLLIQRLENTVYAGENLKNTDAANDLIELVKALEKEIR